jgi:BirA family biotin operon repressor/biotin-[acetyl-CoA-carboxylase] ligase
MKAKIFTLLHQAGGTVSGENLSRELGISRVAVWKHIRQMQAAGLDISSSPKGYRLHMVPDTPFPWRFGDLSDRVSYFPELTSTMDKAMELAVSGTLDFSVVVADRQTRGRGRLRRTWQSDQGGLYFTVTLRPQITPESSALVSFAAALDMVAALRQCHDLQAFVKWPNDILVDERKIVGILSQVVNDHDRVQFINVGVGVNVNNQPEAVGQPAVSVAQLKGGPVSRSDLLECFLRLFRRRLDPDSLPRVIGEWKANTITLGRRVRVQTIHEALEGQAVDIDAQGGLILSLDSGEQRTILYGDCFHQT